MLSTYLKNLNNREKEKSESERNKVKIRLKGKSNKALQISDCESSIDNLSLKIKNDFTELKKNLSDIEDEIILQVPETNLSPREENKIVELKKKISKIDFKKQKK